MMSGCLKCAGKAGWLTWQTDLCLYLVETRILTGTLAIVIEVQAISTSS